MTLSKKKILVVGGAGYIGSILSRELLNKGYGVKIFDRLYFGEEGIKEIKEGLDLVVGDMRQFPPSILDDVEAVINLGGLSNDPTAEYNPQANYEMNTLSSTHLAHLCRERGVRRYIFASSCSVYFSPDKKVEDIIFTEDTKINPFSVYSKSKYEAEKNLLSLTGENFSPVIIRIGTVFGFSPRMRYDLVVNTFIKDALSRGYITLHSKGEMHRPLIDIREVANAFIIFLAEEEEKIKGQIFNLLSQNWKISALADEVKDVLSKMEIKVDIKLSPLFADIRSYQVSHKKMESYLNFKPTISLSDSVKDLIEKINQYNFTDFDHPKYYNIKWMKLLEEAEKIVRITGSIF